MASCLLLLSGWGWGWGCALAGSRRSASPLDFAFAGPGRLVLIWQHTDDEGDVARLLAVYDASGARPLPISGAVEARWLGPDTLILGLDAPSEDPTRLGLTELVVLELGDSQLLRLAAARRHFNLEVSPDRSWLASRKRTPDIRYFDYDWRLNDWQRGS